MNSQLTLEQVVEIAEAMKRKPIIQPLAALVSPTTGEQLISLCKSASPGGANILGHPFITVPLPLGSVKIFVSPKCPPDYFYMGSEAQILDILNRMEQD